MASLSMARNQDRTVDDLKDNDEKNLNRTQRRNPTLKERRCVPRNGRCATDLDCCDGIPCNGYNGNLYCLTNHEYGRAVAAGYVIAGVLIVICCFIGILCGVCRAHYGI